MDIKLLEEPLLQFGKGEYICPRTGIYKYGNYIQSYSLTLVKI